MNDAEYRATKRRIDRLITKWRNVLWLEAWHIEGVYLRVPTDDMAGEPGSGYATYMDIEPRWEYLRAIVRFNMPMVKDLPDDELERQVVHELCHCLVCEMRAWAPNRRQHEERVVSQLTKAIIAAEVRGWNDGKADLKRKQKAEAAKKEQSS